MANINKIYLFLLLIPGISWQLKANDANSEFISLPGSERQYTMQQINDFFNVPDWYPGKHPRMPEVVSHGSKPAVFACASCHLTSGSGHPESASLAGLPVEYQIRQMQAYQKFQRSSVIGVMNNIARAMSEEQIRISAEYFAALPRLRVQEVHETKTVPVTYVNKRFMRLVDKQKNGEEAIGERLISFPGMNIVLKPVIPMKPLSPTCPKVLWLWAKNWSMLVNQVQSPVSVVMVLI